MECVACKHTSADGFPVGVTRGNAALGAGIHGVGMADDWFAVRFVPPVEGVVEVGFGTDLAVVALATNNYFVGTIDDYMVVRHSAWLRVSQEISHWVRDWHWSGVAAEIFARSVCFAVSGRTAAEGMVGFWACLERGVSGAGASLYNVSG